MFDLKAVAAGLLVEGAVLPMRIASMDCVGAASKGEFGAVPTTFAVQMRSVQPEARACAKQTTRWQAATVAWLESAKWILTVVTKGIAARLWETVATTVV